jgi:predicted alternative tryptophan synthase beta-subunit
MATSASPHHKIETKTLAQKYYSAVLNCESFVTASGCEGWGVWTLIR